jgi:hypothetical protein
MKRLTAGWAATALVCGALGAASLGMRRCRSSRSRPGLWPTSLVPGGPRLDRANPCVQLGLEYLPHLITGSIWTKGMSLIAASYPAISGMAITRRVK